MKQILSRKSDDISRLFWPFGARRFWDLQDLFISKSGKLKVLAVVLISFFSIPAYSQSLGSMYAFDGVDDCVSIPAHPSYAIGTADFTIEFWMKLDSTAQGSGKVIFSMQDSATLYGIYIVTFNNSVGLNFQFSGGGSGCYTGSLSFLFDGQCHHYAWVRSGKRLRIYVDGALNITYNNLTTLNIASNDILLGGSKNYFPGNSGLKGALRDFKIWSTPLSQYQIINWLKPTSNNQITNLIGAWKLDGTYKQKVEDKSIKQNHGTRGRSSASESSDPVVVSACPDCIMHPVQLFALNPLIFCIGDSVTMKVTLLPGETCRWYKNGILINGAIDSVYTTKYSGIYSVRVFNSSGCFGYSNALTLKRMMEEIDWPACASCYGVTGEYCWWNGRHDTLTMPVYTGYSYQWYKDSVLIPGATSNTLPVASAGQYYCVVQWNGCSRYSNTARYLPLETTIKAVTSPSTCLDTLVTLRVDQNMYYSPQYQWKVNNSVIPGATFSQLTTSLTGLINCTVKDTLICPSPVTTNTINVSHGVVPNLYLSYNDQLSTSSINYDDCSSSSNGYLKLVDSGNREYVDAGLISTGWYGDFPFSTASPTLIVIDRSGQYGVYYSTACGTGSVAGEVLFTGPQAYKPQVIGAFTSCNPISLSTEYPFLMWNACQWYKDGVPIPGATTYQYIATATGSYSYALWNDCDSILSNSKQVNILGGFNITSPDGTTICTGVSKKLVATVNSSYQWKLNGNNIQGATGSTYFATVAGDYSCQITNSCGSSLSNVITITNGNALSPAPGSLSGPSTICPVTGNKVYSVTPVAGADSYSWVFTNGPTILSNPDSNVVTVSFPSNYSGGKVVVYANNSCSSFALDSLALTSMNLNPPTTILGVSYNTCGAISSFSCPTVQNATSYNWQVPPGVVIVNGQGTKSVNIAFPGGPGADTIKVSALNSCMSSPYFSKFAQRVPFPAASISGTTSVCAFQTGLYYSTPVIAGATSYLWTVPLGASITGGQGTSTIQINMGNASGTVSVAGVNACGVGSAFVKSIHVVCKEGELNLTEPPVLNVHSGKGKLVADYSIPSAMGVVYLFNSLGQLVDLREVNHSGSDSFVFEGLENGIYLIELRTDNQVLTRRGLAY